jgi:hypothetical protein
MTNTNCTCSNLNKGVNCDKHHYIDVIIDEGRETLKDEFKRKYFLGGNQLTDEVAEWWLSKLEQEKIKMFEEVRDWVKGKSWECFEENMIKADIIANLNEKIKTLK